MSFSTLFPVPIMNAHEPHRGALIAEAAALRAAGQSWETIGAAVDRHADTVRRWPDRYRDEWCRTYRAVEAQLRADAAIEARTTLRAMLRDKRGKYRLGAATQLLKSRDHTLTAEAAPADVDPPVSRECELFYQELNAMSEEELDRMNERYRMRAHEQKCVGGAGI